MNLPALPISAGSFLVGAGRNPRWPIDFMAQLLRAAAGFVC